MQLLLGLAITSRLQCPASLLTLDGRRDISLALIYVVVLSHALRSDAMEVGRISFLSWDLAVTQHRTVCPYQTDLRPFIVCHMTHAAAVRVPEQRTQYWPVAPAEHLLQAKMCQVVVPSRAVPCSAA